MSLSTSAMKKRLTGFLGRNSSPARSSDGPQGNGDTPEAVAGRGVRLFCESGPNDAGEEVLHLPAIVDAAESSPSAAKEAAHGIREFLGKDNFGRSHVQFNAIMLWKILVDNPGPSFTKNMDAKFVETVKTLLRDGPDLSVQHILREALDKFQAEKAQDENLTPLLTMWQAEKVKWAGKRGVNTTLQSSSRPQPRQLNAPAFDSSRRPQQNYFARHHSYRGLPTVVELAHRIEEARTSGKLLSQVVQSTPPNEILQNDLIKEFADRCSSASQSIQSYIAADNPPPDEDTMLNLIETNEQLSMAMSKHQRAVLKARRLTTTNTSTPRSNPNPRVTGRPVPPPPSLPSQLAVTSPPKGPPPPTTAPHDASTSALPGPPVENPFADLNMLAGAQASSLQETPPTGAPPVPAVPKESSQSSSYHPGYQPTPSYVHRQDSAAHYLTMHGAGTTSTEAEDDPEIEQPKKYRF